MNASLDCQLSLKPVFQPLELSPVNQAFLANILIAQRSGQGCLPLQLGLSANEFKLLVDSRFSGLQGLLQFNSELLEMDAIRTELLSLREDEWQDLVTLLNEHARGEDISETWLAKIIASACMGNDHLWRALGLPNRQSLRELITQNFPGLAEKNTGDMRWKKFFYRQICEQGGHFVCRSPSCETCPTYDECFGEEV